MTTTSKFLLIAAPLALCLRAQAQAPAGAPSGANGICKDGTYSTGLTKDGACRGHKGVQTWYKPAATTTKGSPAAAATAPPSPATTRGEVTPSTQATPVSPPQAVGPPPTRGAVPAQTSAPAPPVKSGISAERAKLATMQPAPGGGPGFVWLNGSSKVYHCPGSEFYGKTKTGAYLPEADAKAKGAHPDHNKPCS